MPTGVYLGSYPDPRFCFTRSYAIQLEIVGDTNDVDVSGDTYTMWIDRIANYGIVYILNDYIKPWSSNGYTLDHIVYDCWWFFGFDGVHHPQGFTTNFWGRGADHVWTISVIQPAGGSASFIEELPPAPPGYWLENPDLINFS